MEAFRPEVSGGGICLYMSLGAVPVEKIQLCDVPDGFVGFSNPRYSGATAAAWRLYNKDVFLFSGDFGFIYEGYSDEGPFRQSAAFVDPCQCAAYNLYRRGVVIRNVCQFLDVQYVQYGKPSSYAEYAENVVGLVQKNKFSNAQIVVGNQFGKLVFK